MRVRVRTGLVALLLALLVAPWSSREDDPEDCPAPLSDAYLRSEEGQRYVRELEKLMGSTDPSDWSGDSYATYFTVTCDG